MLHFRTFVPVVLFLGFSTLGGTRPVVAQSVGEASGDAARLNAPSSGPLSLGDMSSGEKVRKLNGGNAFLRHNFTVELGIGGGLNFNNRERLSGGVSPINFSMGGFLSDSVALLGHFSSLSPADDRDSRFAWFGPQLQVWPSTRLMLAFGAGVSQVNGGNSAFGLSVRVGYSLWHGNRHSIRVAIEAVPTWVDSSVSMGQTLVLEWQAH